LHNLLNLILVILNKTNSYIHFFFGLRWSGKSTEIKLTQLWDPGFEPGSWRPA
jgi:hypothetical protein